MQRRRAVLPSWSAGLRLRLWVWMVGVAAVAVGVMAAGVSVSAGRPRVAATAGAGWAAATALVMAGLAWAFDRPGRVRRWRVLGAASLTVPVAVLVVDLTLARWLGRLDVVEVVALAAFQGALAAWAWRFVPALWPARCPACGVAALLRVEPRGDFPGDSDDDLRECAECLAVFRRPRHRPPRGAPHRWARFEPGPRTD